MSSGIGYPYFETTVKAWRGGRIVARWVGADGDIGRLQLKADVIVASMRTEYVGARVTCVTVDLSVPDIDIHAPDRSVRR